MTTLIYEDENQVTHEVEVKNQDVYNFSDEELFIDALEEYVRANLFLPENWRVK